MTILRFFTLTLLSLTACDLAPTINEYTAKCRKLGGHTVETFGGGGHIVLICVGKDGQVLEP